MPNKVFYTDNRTPVKAIRALTQDGAMDLDAALSVMDRLQGNNLEIVEPAPKNATVSPENE